jgi:hypothetical protein
MSPKLGKRRFQIRALGEIIKRRSNAAPSTRTTMHFKLNFWSSKKTRLQRHFSSLSTGLQQLPLELQILIIESACSHKLTCVTLCLTSQWTRAIANKNLYHTVVIRTWKYVGSISNAPGLAHVKNLDLAIDAIMGESDIRPPHLELIPVFKTILHRMPLLQHLSFNVTMLGHLMLLENSDTIPLPAYMTVWPVYRGSDYSSFHIRWATMIFPLSIRRTRPHSCFSVTHLQFERGVSHEVMVDFDSICTGFPNVTHIAWTIDSEVALDMCLQSNALERLPDTLSLVVLHLLVDEGQLRLYTANRAELTIRSKNWPQERIAVIVDKISWTSLGEDFDLWTRATIGF